MTEEQAQSLIEEQEESLVDGWKDGAIFNLDFLSASIKIPIDDWKQVKKDLQKIINDN